MDEQQPGVASVAVPATDDVSAIDLHTLFRPDASATDRVRALQAFGGTARTRLQDVVSSASQGADAVAERCGQLLSEVAHRLPIRRAEDLRRQFGADPRSQAEHVVDDAVTLARWLWVAVKAVPAPEPVAHAAKVVLHSAIEIRMVGELLESYRDADADDAMTPLPAILAMWAGAVGDAPGEPARPTLSGAAVLVAQVRRALKDLRGSDSRIKGIVNRGREGGDIVRSVGEKVSSALRQQDTAA
ncbi:MAG TPA: hypothetical protein VFC00_21090 [Micromonosporaceae bacterium]|nr:hypothetical protein [Micromonosporaceae bacterium]